MKSTKRILSIDLLRGLDICFLTFLGPLFRTLLSHSKHPFCHAVSVQLHHVAWEGLSVWDMIMPLFLFTAGLSLPFAMKKFEESPASFFYYRIIKRVILLWLIGGIIQGNFLAFDSQQIYLFSNTLQAIAVGYFFSALFYRYLNRNLQIVATAFLFLTYLLLMTFVGGNDYTREGNLCEQVDRFVLGRFRDGAYYDEQGIWHFANWYHYTWVLSSLNFVVTVMMGVFAGEIIKNNIKNKIKTAKYLFVYALISLFFGYIMSIWIPIVKTIWNSSMTLITGGYSILLLAIIYFFVDIKEARSGWFWFRFWGVNSIAAYFMHWLNFGSITKSLVAGFAQFTGEYYDLLYQIVDLSIPVFILYLMYRGKYFIRC